PTSARCPASGDDLRPHSPHEGANGAVLRPPRRSNRRLRIALHGRANSRFALACAVLDHLIVLVVVSECVLGEFVLDLADLVAEVVQLVLRLFPGLVGLLFRVAPRFLAFALCLLGLALDLILVHLDAPPNGFVRPGSSPRRAAPRPSPASREPFVRPPGSS